MISARRLPHAAHTINNYKEREESLRMAPIIRLFATESVQVLCPPSQYQSAARAAPRCQPAPATAERECMHTHISICRHTCPGPQNFEHTTLTACASTKQENQSDSFPPKPPLPPFGPHPRAEHAQAGGAVLATCSFVSSLEPYLQGDERGFSRRETDGADHDHTHTHHHTSYKPPLA